MKDFIYIYIYIPWHKLVTVVYVESVECMVCLDSVLLHARCTNYLGEGVGLVIRPILARLAILLS